MGWRLRFRRVLRSGPFRWTLSKGGIGWSWGFPGFRYGVSANGQRYVSVGVPGTGLYWIRYLGRAPDGHDAELPHKPPPTDRRKGTAQPWWKDHVH